MHKALGKGARMLIFSFLSAKFSLAHNFNKSIAKFSIIKPLKML
jgi:hypothetical protein